MTVKVTKPETEKPSVSPCPVCRKPSADAYRPFCSKRCAEIDLGRWVTGSYVISGSEDADDDVPQGASDGEKKAED